MVVKCIFSCDVKGVIHKELNRRVRICVRALAEEIADLRLNSQFFEQFPPKAFFRRFMRLDLTAGEFPHAGEPPTFLSLGYEELAVSLNEGSSDKKRLHRAPSAGGKVEVEAKVEMKKSKNILR